MTTKEERFYKASIDRIAELEEQITQARIAIGNLKSYLYLPKFHRDTTVQVKDVLNRLEEVERCFNE